MNLTLTHTQTPACFIQIEIVDSSGKEQFVEDVKGLTTVTVYFCFNFEFRNKSLTCRKLIIWFFKKVLSSLCFHPLDIDDVFSSHRKGLMILKPNIYECVGCVQLVNIYVGWSTNSALKHEKTVKQIKKKSNSMSNGWKAKIDTVEIIKRREMIFPFKHLKHKL